MRLVRSFFAAVLLAAALSIFVPVSAQACMNCPCLNIKKDGPCLLR